MWPLICVHGATICLFLLLGIVFSCGKGTGLIAGYNTASAREKARYDEKALCRFMGRFMFVLAACWIPMLLSTLLDMIALLWIGLAVFLTVIISGVIYANTGNRFMVQ